MISRCLSLVLLTAPISFAAAQDEPSVKAEKARLIEVRLNGISELKMAGSQEIREVQSADGKVLIRPKDQGRGGFTQHFRVLWSKDHEKLLIHGLLPGATRLHLVSKEGKTEKVDVLVFLQIFVLLETKKPREMNFPSIKRIEVANEKALRVALKEGDDKIAVVTPLQSGDFRFVVVGQDGEAITVIVRTRSLKAPGKNTIIVAEKETVEFRPKNKFPNHTGIGVEDDRACRVIGGSDPNIYYFTGVQEGWTKITVRSPDDKIIEEYDLIVRAAKD